MNEKVINLKGNPDAGNTDTTIPPGFQPMPPMTTVPILGHTAKLQPITVKGNTKDECPACAGGWKKDFTKSH